MERLKAKVLDGDKLLYEGDVWIEAVESRGLQGWHGGFSIPKAGAIQPNMPYSFVADDGRQAKIFVKHISAGSHRDTEVHFRVMGPFE